MTAERTKEPGAQDEPQRNQLLIMAIREPGGTLPERDTPDVCASAFIGNRPV
jgi:hypothetical protein